MTERTQQPGPGLTEEPDLEVFSRTGDPTELEHLLEAFDRLPVHRHAEVYDRLHAVLRRRLDAEADHHPRREPAPRP